MLVIEYVGIFHCTLLHVDIISLYYCNNFTFFEETHLHSIKSALVPCRSNALLVTQLRGTFPGCHIPHG